MYKILIQVRIVSPCVHSPTIHNPHTFTYSNMATESLLVSSPDPSSPDTSSPDTSSRGSANQLIAFAADLRAKGFAEPPDRLREAFYFLKEGPEFDGVRVCHFTRENNLDRSFGCPPSGGLDDDATVSVEAFVIIGGKHFVLKSRLHYEAWCEGHCGGVGGVRHVDVRDSAFHWPSMVRLDGDGGGGGDGILSLLGDVFAFLHHLGRTIGDYTYDPDDPYSYSGGSTVWLPKNEAFRAYALGEPYSPEGDEEEDEEEEDEDEEEEDEEEEGGDEEEEDEEEDCA